MNKRQRKKQIKMHKKHIIKQNKLLVKHYPFLLPRNVFSDKVPTEVGFSDACQFISLQKSTTEWAETLAKVLREKRERGSQSNLQLQSDYHIENAKQMLVKYYVDLKGV